jgi:hypothetical protein
VFQFFVFSLVCRSSGMVSWWFDTVLKLPLLLVDDDWSDFPDVGSILRNGAVAGESSGMCDILHIHLQPAPGIIKRTFQPNLGSSISRKIFKYEKLIIIMQ